MESRNLKLILEEKEVNYFVWWTICRDFTISNILKKYLGKPFKNQLVYYDNGNGHWATDILAWKKLGAKLVDNICSNNFDIKSLIEEHFFYGQRLEKELEEIVKKDFSKLDPKHISDWLDKVIADYLKLNEFGFVAVVSDIEHSFLSKRLSDILSQKLPVEKISETLNKLITSDKKNIFWQEEEELINLLIKYNNISKLKNSKEFKEHIVKYVWINFGYLGSGWEKKDFLNRVREIISKGEPRDILKKHKAQLTSIKNDQKKLTIKLRLSKKEQFVFQAARDFSFLKNYRVGLRYHFCYVINLLFRELSRRSDIPIDVFYYANQQELNKLIFGQIEDYKYILARKNFYCEYYEGNKLSIISKKELSEIKKHFIKDKIIKTDELSGQVAFLGKVSGRVKIVLSSKDINKVKVGDILVAIYTDPNLLPAMKKAIAFVTEQGGITSHAAIVAREMKKPCIIGTRIATKVLKDGDLVEVDANNGIVKKL